MPIVAFWTKISILENPAIASHTLKSRLFEYKKHFYTDRTHSQYLSCPTSIVDEVADERVPTTIDTEETEEETTPK